MMGLFFHCSFSASTSTRALMATRADFNTFLGEGSFQNRFQLGSGGGGPLQMLIAKLAHVQVRASTLGLRHRLDR